MSTLSIVVVAYDMARELPRTLHTLSAAYQVGISASDYEVIVVDNGSPEPISEQSVASFGGQFRLVTMEAAPPSPARAANVGIAAATGSAVGLIVDGARMASPGLIANAVRALGLAPRPVVASLGWHLGSTRHMDASRAGYDQIIEDQLLETVDWRRDGYTLFDISTLGASSSRGWFGPMGESSALFMPLGLWKELGGLDERFRLPGGGLVNHDLYRRALESPNTQSVVLLGEGTFHQFHGGAATSERFQWEEMQRDYAELRGHRFVPLEVESLFIGEMSVAASRHASGSPTLDPGSTRTPRRWAGLRSR